ncbi:MAG: TIGR00725 family protein [Actinomycetota bacterium]
MSDLYVAVVGAGEAEPDLTEVAYDVGRGLGRAGAVLVCGGLGGVMEAACRGAKDAGGTTVGILPYESRSHANPYVDIALPTGMGEMRNALIVRSADAVIAVGGEFGTLSEVAFALKTGVPVVGIDTWELVKRGQRSDALEYASSAEEAVTTALRLAAG